MNNKQGLVVAGAVMLALAVLLPFLFMPLGMGGVVMGFMMFFFLSPILFIVGLILLIVGLAARGGGGGQQQQQQVVVMTASQAAAQGITTGRCGNCGTPLSPGDAFCGGCGGRVARG